MMTSVRHTLIMTAVLITALLSATPALAGLPPALKARLAQGGLPEIPPPPDARCTLSAGGGEVDYGVLSRGQMTPLPGQRSLLTPGVRSLMLTVTCPDARSLALSMTGEASPSARGLLRYGDGGAVSLRMKDASVDGQSVMLRTITRDGRSAGRASASASLTPGAHVEPVLNGRPVRGNTLVARLEVMPALNEKATRVTAPSTLEARFGLRLDD